MGTKICFVLPRDGTGEQLFDLIESNRKSTVFSGYIPGIEKAGIGTKVTIIFCEDYIDVEIMKVVAPKPEDRNRGQIVELRHC
jgi:hypothetical protein